MLDLDRRLRALDQLEVPDLWDEIERRAVARRPLERRPALPGRGPWARRFAVVAAAVLLVVAAIVVVLPRPPSALAVMQDAQEAFADVPPFRAELTRFVRGSSSIFDEFPEHTGQDWVYHHDLWYGGSRGWRREIVDDTLPFMRGGRGSFMVFDGEQTGIYFAHATGPEGGNARSFYMKSGEDAEFSPLRELSPEPTGGIGKLIPTRAGPGVSFDMYFEERCRVLPDDLVAGRVAKHLSCEAGYQELWIDAETGLILRHVTPESRQEIESIEYNPAFPRGIFEFEPPPDAVEAGREEPSATGLTVGQPVATWTGPLLGGGELSLESLRGKPAALYLWASWCPPCVGDPLESFDEARRARGEAIHFVSVATRDTRDSVEALISKAGYHFPVVFDEQDEIATKWKVTAIPVLVLLDAEGRLLASYPGPLSSNDLERVLDALASGRPIPEVTADNE